MYGELNIWVIDFAVPNLMILKFFVWCMLWINNFFLFIWNQLLNGRIFYVFKFLTEDKMISKDLTPLCLDSLNLTKYHCIWNKGYFGLFPKNHYLMFLVKKWHKKNLETYFYYFFLYLRKLSRNWGKFSSTALVVGTFYVKYCSLLKQC